VVVIGSGIQMFLVENDILNGFACRLPAVLRKGEPSQNRHWNVRLRRGETEGNEQSCDDIVTAIVSWSIVRVFFCATAPLWARVSSFTRFLDHTQWRTTVGRTPLDEWSARRRALPDNTQHSQQTNFHAPGGFRTLSRRAAADLRLKDRVITGTRQS